MTYPQVLLQNRKPDRIATLEEYQQSGGYQALEDVLHNYSYKDLQEVLIDAVLLGRGGAAFPAGMKLRTVRRMHLFRDTSCATPMRWSQEHSKIGS